MNNTKYFKGHVKTNNLNKCLYTYKNQPVDM